MNNKEPKNNKTKESKKIIKIIILAIIAILVISMILYGINNAEELSQLTGGELDSLMIKSYVLWNY